MFGIEATRCDFIVALLAVSLGQILIPWTEVPATGGQEPLRLVL